MIDSQETNLSPELETLSYKPTVNKEDCDWPACTCEDDNCPEQPNKNLMIIEEIEGLISQVNEKLERLEAYYGKSNVKNQALEEIDLFQKTTLFELRKAFE